MKNSYFFEIENKMEIEIRPSFWNRTLMRHGIGQELIMMMYREETVDFVRPFLISRCHRIMKGIPIEKIEMMVDFNVNIQGDFEADFSEEKCNEKFAHVDVRLLA